MNKKSAYTGYKQEGFCGSSYAARLLNMSVGTVHSLVENNVLSAWKTQGGHRRISLQSIQDYQLANNIQPIKLPSYAGKAQVLVVEDDDNTRQMYEAYFERWALPLDIVIYGSALEALLDLHLFQPVVLLTDLHMSKMNGFEFIKTIREHKTFATLPIIAITGMSPEKITDAGGLSKDVLILEKPIDMAWLKGFLEGIISLNTFAKK